MRILSSEQTTELLNRYSWVPGYQNSPMLAVRKKSVRTKRSRCGAAVTELAVCLPLIFILLMGSLDACNMIFLKQALTAAAYEGAREGTEPSATNSDVTTRVNEVLTARGITSYTLITNPNDITTTPLGDPITVTVSTANGGLSIIPSAYRQNANLSAQVVMLRE